MSGVVVIVVDSTPSEGEALAADLRTILGGLADVEVVADAQTAHDGAVRVESGGGLIALAFVDVDLGENPSTTVLELHDDPALSRTKNVLVTSRASLHGADQALQRGAVHGMITRPWTERGLRAQLEANLAAFLTEHAPDRLGDFSELLDDDVLARARARLEQMRSATHHRPSSTPLLLDGSIDDDEIETRMLALLDRALGHPPRIRVAPGTVLIEAGDDVGGIYVVLDGVVRLSSRISSGEQILHEQSTGAIIGLLSLASHRTAMLQCRALTEVRAIPVTLDQLAEALEAEPELSSLLTRVLVSSLARRLRRSDEMQIELDESLVALSDARAQLVATARFAALGEIAAGMAHELNNPTAALVRATEHLARDVAAVVSDADARRSMERQLDAAPLETSQLRALRRELSEILDDHRLADRLIDIGFTDVDSARAAARLDGPELDRLQAAAHLGQSLHNLTGAAARIQSLVGSLRAYSRGEDGRGALVPGVDVATGVDDALTLLSHRMKEVDLRREYSATPKVTARPGELQQVWTNLIANALDATHDRGTLTVHVGQAGTDRVIVQVIDDGPGITPDVGARIFEPRFTTKDGRVQFGLGLGLSISRQIVEDHGGTIRMNSEPGRTEFTVDLPTGEGS